MPFKKGHGRLNKFKPNKVIYQDDIITKFLIESKKHGNFEVVIDTEDYDKIKLYHWGMDSVNNKHYISAFIKNKNTHLHRFVIYINNSKTEIDHINHNTFDNRKSNLRICTHSQNMRNRGKQKNNTSGFKGVTWDKRKNKWLSQITFNYKHMFWGYFSSKVEASKKYNETAKQYFGDFAHIEQNLK